jgi:hypothetical protein
VSKPVSKSASKPKKAYSTPKLATHGDVRKITQHPGKSHEGGDGRSRGMGSNIFDFGGHKDD